MNIFVILPTQLFEKKYLHKKYNYIIWEHPHYFKSYKYNKKKILLHSASMRYYYDYLKSSKFKVSYVSYDEKIKLISYKIFDPIDKIKLPGKYKMIESPNFLLTKDDYIKYRDKTDKFFFNAFYMWSKKQLNILPKVISQDKLNRKKLPDIKIPKIPKTSSNKQDMKYIKIGTNYVNNNFSKNYGNTCNFMFPVTHKTAKKWLKDFIKNKLEKFGDYQDAITQEDGFLFHSILSTSINIGLLNPSEIIEEVLNAKTIPLNSLEGYIRQLFWREYQRYCYIYYNFNNKNYFGNTSKLTKKWYNGTLDIPPVDNAIIKGFDIGYLHHIDRLMVVGNYMNLSGIHPKEGFKWFMEFSCDSYEWVMHQNVLDMVFFVSGGDTMRRPYISSSNYILKMSNYKKDTWSDKWDKKYYKFLEKNKKKLWKFRYHFRGLKK
jgi:deoxyribodipyrimidine photolyase-related protein